MSRAFAARRAAGLVAQARSASGVDDRPNGVEDWAGLEQVGASVAGNEHRRVAGLRLGWLRP
ncbi:hypothetical protein, partial [uncultured Rikenella sp.]|uniref:hypothetical protein n=1 Tax=uncultured Rikenella sp. TaxID=368003 RepID=UPI0025E7F8F7